MRRVMAMQDYLMDALHLDDPESAIVDRVAAMLEADAVLLGVAGGSYRGPAGRIPRKCSRRSARGVTA